MEMINNIFQSLDVLRKVEQNSLPILRTYLGKAYKPTEDPEGVIGYKLIKRFVNAFQTVDSINYYLIHRKYFWSEWSEHCGLNVKPKTAIGVTINREIYDDMLSDRNDGVFNITNKTEIYRFKVKIIIDFVEHMRTFAINQNHGFEEVGFPISLHDDIIGVKQ